MYTHSLSGLCNFGAKIHHFIKNTKKERFLCEIQSTFAVISQLIRNFAYNMNITILC